MIETFCDKREYIEYDGAKLVRYLQVPVSDSMKFTFTFLYDGEWSTRKCYINNVDVVFEFYTEEQPDTKFTASKIGEDCTNCLFNDESSTIRVIMNDHGLSQGKLLCRMVINYSDPEMPDGIGTVVRVVDPKIALVDNLEQGRWIADASKPNNFSIAVRMPYVGDVPPVPHEVTESWNFDDGQADNFFTSSGTIIENPKVIDELGITINHCLKTMSSIGEPAGRVEFTAPTAGILKLYLNEGINYPAILSDSSMSTTIARLNQKYMEIELDAGSYLIRGTQTSDQNAGTLIYYMSFTYTA